MATEHAGMSPWPSWIGEASLPLPGQLRATGEGAPTRHSRGACRYDAMAMEISGRFLAIAKPRGSTVEGSAAIATSWRRGVGMSCRMTIGELRIPGHRSGRSQYLSVQVAARYLCAKC